MRQVVQELRSGALKVATVPDPVVQPGHVLIANVRSLVSAGTEKMVMDLAKKSLLGKARERPDQVRRALQKMKAEGMWATWKSIRQKLDEPMKMGYASAGIVLACGAGVSEFQVGDRVASNGPHAGVVCIPKHLCARIPDGVPFDQAAFCVLGAISLQGVRLARIGLGDTAYVIGLGLLGQITVGLLKAAGCRVLGTDLDASKCEIALRLGADAASPELGADAVNAATHGHGADAVLITAATPSSGPVALAGEAVRAKGRVVAVGAVGLDLPRRPYYFKEAEFVVSCSYGPGRYDAEYEDRGRDYPFAHVRWTEQRNMQAVLDLMAGGRLDLTPLVTHRFAIEEAESAYRMIEESSERYLAILLTYPEGEKRSAQPVVALRATPSREGVGVACLGSGGFARAVLLPALSKMEGVRLRTICSAGGLSAADSGAKLGFEQATTDVGAVLSDPKVDLVVVSTRHDQHATQVIRALQAGKHVFVEKPLALTLEEVDAVEAALAATDGKRLLLVGFNRRFAPATQTIRKHFAGVTAPLTVSVRFNAGSIPADHWTQSDEVGGGRIVGEACHAIDLAACLAGSPPVRVFAQAVGGDSAPAITDDQAFITLRHANGAISSVAYLSGGDRAFPKERVEVIGGGRVGVIEDWRAVVTAADGRVRKSSLRSQDKGHRAELTALIEAIQKGGPPPMSWAEIRSASVASILAVQSLREGVPFDVP